MLSTMPDEALRELALTSPIGYFLDNVALIAHYLRGTSRTSSSWAAPWTIWAVFEIASLEKKSFKGVRTLQSWVEGHLYVQVGDLRRAQNRVWKARTGSWCRKAGRGRR